MESYPTQKIDYPSLKSVFTILLAKMVVYTYKIEAKKHQSTSLYFKMNLEIHHYCLSIGPGFLSPRKIIMKETNLIIETFQFMYQIIYYIETFDIRYFPPVFFMVRPLKSKTVNLTENDKKLFDIPGSKRRESINTCVFVVKVPQHFYIDFTIFTFSFTGPPHSECHYGGISLNDYISNNVQETFLMCNKYNYTNQYRPFEHQTIHSSNFTMLLVIYQYKEYGSLILNVSLSWTYCKGIKIDFCHLSFKRNRNVEIYTSKSLRLIHKSYLVRVRELAMNLGDKSCFVLQMYQNKKSKAFMLIYLFSNYQFFYCKLDLRTVEETNTLGLWKFKLSGYCKVLFS